MCEAAEGLEGLAERLLRQVKRGGVAPGVDAVEHAEAVAAEVERARRAAEERERVRELRMGILREMS